MCVHVHTFGGQKVTRAKYQSFGTPNRFERVQGGCSTRGAVLGGSKFKSSQQI